MEKIPHIVQHRFLIYWYSYRQRASRLFLQPCKLYQMIWVLVNDNENKFTRFQKTGLSRREGISEHGFAQTPEDCNGMCHSEVPFVAFH